MHMPACSSRLSQSLHRFGLGLACGWAVTLVQFAEQPARGAPLRMFLQAAIDRGLARATSVDGWLRDTPWNQVWSKLTAAELAEVLARQRLSTIGSSGPALLAEAQRRGFADEHWRPDGLLTAWGTAPGGSLLSQPVVAAKRTLEQSFARDPLGWLEPFSRRRVLELLDDRIAAAPAPVVKRFQVFSSDKDAAEVPYNFTIGYALVDDTNRRGQRRISTPEEAEAATASMAPGCAYIRSSSFHLLRTEGFYEGFVDPVDATGVACEYPLVWMDRWAATIGPKFDTFFSRYRDLGGRLDVFSLDVEDKSFSLHELTRQAPAAGAGQTSRSVWQALFADTRWPALAQQLAAVGLDDLRGIERWYAARDPRAAFWNAAMEARRASYLRQAIEQPVRKYFPRVRMTNYANYHHCQTVPCGDTFRFGDSAWGAGAVVGTHQSYPMYASTDTVVTLDGQFGPIPPAVVRVRSAEVVAGRMTVTAAEAVAGLAVGEQVQVKQRVPGEFTDRSGVKVDGARYSDLEARLLEQPRPNVLVLSTSLADASRIDLADSGRGLALSLWRSYPGMLNDLMYARSMAAASRRPMLPWLEHPSLKQSRDGWRDGHPYFAETVFHLALSGADDFLLWVWSKLEGTTAGDAQLGQAVAELDPLVGCAERQTLSFEGLTWDEPYALTGMETAGRRVWRLTPRPGEMVEVRSESPVVIRVGAKEVSLPGSRLYRAPQPVSELGYWIVQTAVPSPLLVGVDEAFQRLGDLTRDATEGR